MSQGFYDEELLSDEELEARIDELLLPAAEEVAEDELGIHVTNPRRMQELMAVYKLMQHMTRGASAKVSYKIHEPFTSMGSVSVTGKVIPVKKPELFLRAASLASNFEVYPKVDGTVMMTFTFHGLTRKGE